jgi:hypothetical protein
MARKQKHFYNDQDEYRWEFPNVGQGHYFLAGDEEEARQSALEDARSRKRPGSINVQRFKPTRGHKKTIYYD